MIWQPEFTDKTLSRKPGAVQHESICAVIRSPVTEEKPAPVSTAPAVVRKVKGCYSSPFNH
ncbi:hypothetical protein [Escherichia coli]